jgi:hypothetical protein
VPDPAFDFGVREPNASTHQRTRHAVARMEHARRRRTTFGKSVRTLGGRAAHVRGVTVRVTSLRAGVAWASRMPLGACLETAGRAHIVTFLVARERGIKQDRMCRLPFRAAFA